jgi:hypothetical protein
MLLAGFFVRAGAQAAPASFASEVDQAIPTDGAALRLEPPAISTRLSRSAGMVKGNPAAPLQGRGLAIAVSPAPEPGTLIAGAILLIPFAASTFRTLRRRI